MPSIAARWSASVSSKAATQRVGGTPEALEPGVPSLVEVAEQRHAGEVPPRRLGKPPQQLRAADGDDPFLEEEVRPELRPAALAEADRDVDILAVEVDDVDSSTGG
jgi:hypothetical protein